MAINKIKKIELVIPENLMSLKYEGCEDHNKKLENLLDTFKPEEKEEVKTPTENKIVKKSKGVFYASMFAGIGFTGFAGFLLYYLIKKRF